MGSGTAGTRFDFLFNMSHVSDDNQLFLNLAVGNFGYPRQVVEPVLPRLQYVETDLPVVLFLARESGRSVDSIVALRSRGLSWTVIFTRVGVPHDRLFVGIGRDPGPPYGRAWGHWRMHPRQVRLTDDEVCGLVQVQVGRRLEGLSPYELARARGQGRPVYLVVADKHGRPYHRGRWSRDDARDDRGQRGNGHHHGHNDHGNDGGDRGHGHDYSGRRCGQRRRSAGHPLRLARSGSPNPSSGIMGTLRSAAAGRG